MTDLSAPFRHAIYACDYARAKAHLTHVAADAEFKLCQPFGTTQGAEAYFDHAYGTLLGAMPDLERRDWIVMSGTDPMGFEWIGTAGHYMGTFTAPFIDIPPTGHMAHMRFHEFYRFKGGEIVEMQAIWDIPELMIQAKAWPLAPSLGRELMIPGPATLDGCGPHAGDGQAAMDVVNEMLINMGKHPVEPPKAMKMDAYWHANMNWYGPAGIGSMRQIRGFRNWHQIPFLNAMPDRSPYSPEQKFHTFSAGNYVAVTGWPNMTQTLTQDGWLGIAPSGKTVHLSSLDFWRVEDGKIRENWVMLDLIDLYAQLGVDVFQRLREFNKARNMNPIHIPEAMT